MKTKNLNLAFILITVFFVTLISCEGEIGPAGADGIDGIDGTDGTDGNANVTVKTFDFDYNTMWSVGSYLGNTSNYHIHSDADITQSILDNGQVVVYFELFVSGTWYPMPFSWYSDATDQQTITNTVALETLTIYAFTTNGVMNGAITKVKYLIIPGNTLKSNVDFNDYYATMDYFELKY